MRERLLKLYKSTYSNERLEESRVPRRQKVRFNRLKYQEHTFARRLLKVFCVSVASPHCRLVSTRPLVSALSRFKHTCQRSDWWGIGHPHRKAKDNKWGQGDFRILPRSTCFSNNRSDFRVSDETRLPVMLSRVLPLVECTFLITPTDFLKVLRLGVVILEYLPSHQRAFLVSARCFERLTRLPVSLLPTTSCLVYFPNT